MAKFLKNIIIFFLLSIIAGEVIIRSNHLTSDLPNRIIDEYGIQKYYPNQKGYWLGGNHKWKINKLGWPGDLPNSYDNLITIIGDSYIENFMSPNRCHQSILLKEKMIDYNFLEAGRSGVSFIESMEIIQQMNSFKPIHTLIYVNEGDFIESVRRIQELSDITQVDLESGNIVNGKMKSTGLKKILYAWKLMYYFYNRFPLNISQNKVLTKGQDNLLNYNRNDLKFKNQIFELIDYVKENYPIINTTLIFHPDTNTIIVDQCKNVGFNVIILNSDNDKSWKFEHDSHWTCYGHKQVAEQVSAQLVDKLIK
jgi:hypothetical protein